MSFAESSGGFDQHSLMQFGDAASSPEDKMLRNLGASSQAPVFGSQSVLTQELKAHHFSLSQDTVSSFKSAARQQAAIRLNAEKGDFHSLSQDAAMASDNRTGATGTGASQYPHAFHESLTFALEEESKAGHWDSLLNAVDIKLLEQDLIVEEEPGSLESLILAYAGSPSKSPFKKDQQSQKDSIVKTIKPVKYALQEKSPNRLSKSNPKAALVVESARRSSRHHFPKKEPKSAATAPLINILHAAPKGSPVSKHKNSKSALTWPLGSELVPTSKSEGRSRIQFTNANITAGDEQGNAALCSVWESGVYSPIAAVAAAVHPQPTNRSKASGSKAKPARATSKSRPAKKEKTVNRKRQPPTGVPSYVDIMPQMLLDCPGAAKNLYHEMVMTHSQPVNRGPTPSPGFLELSFQWNHYPPLENILLKNMERYFELSRDKNHFREQFAFNNMLCDNVIKTTKKYGWNLDSKVTNKQIRDRIRCYFKTLIQNAKKRLATMLRDRSAPSLQQIQIHWQFCLAIPEIEDYLEMKRWSADV